MVRPFVWALGVFIAALLPAQELAPGSPTPTVPRLVNAIVSDARGNHIGGLTAADFQVLQRGKNLEIMNFSEVARTAGAPDTAARRTILVAFDMSSLSIAGRKKSIDASRQLLTSRVRPGDRVRIVQVSSAGVATPAGGWTSDATEIDRQLRVIDGLSVTDRSVERKRIEQNIQSVVEFGGPMTTFDSLVTMGRHYASSVRAEVKRTLSALLDVIGLMGEGSGDKVLILAGGGLSTRPGSEIFESLDRLKAQAEMGQLGPSLARDAKRTNPRGEISQYAVSKEVSEVALDARDHGVVIYSLQPDTSGSTQLAVERTEMADTAADFAGVADQMSGYTVLASTTGGLALIGATPESAVAAICSDFDSHYVLTIRQPASLDSTLPRIDVKVRQSGHGVRAAFAGGPLNADAEIRDLVVANHTATSTSNDLQIALKNDDPVAAGSNRKVALTVVIPLKSLKLTPAGDEVTASFAVYVSTGDAQGHASEVNRQTKKLRFPAAAVSQLMEKSIGFRVEVLLAPGRTQISVGVLDPNSQRTGYAKIAI